MQCALSRNWAAAWLRPCARAPLLADAPQGATIVLHLRPIELALNPIPFYPSVQRLFSYMLCAYRTFLTPYLLPIVAVSNTLSPSNCCCRRPRPGRWWRSSWKRVQLWSTSRKCWSWRPSLVCGQSNFLATQSPCCVPCLPVVSG